MDKKDKEKLVAEFKASGMNCAKFAQKVGVNRNTFYGWAFPESKKRHSNKYKKAPTIYKPEFKELEVTKDKGKQIEIELPGGVIIKVRS